MGNFLSWLTRPFHRTREEYLKEAELQILQKFSNISCQSQFIPISNRVEIRTLRFDTGLPRASTPIVVLLHGLLSGLGVWSPTFDLLSQCCFVYAIDLPGFGRSTRAQFLGDFEDVEYQFVNYLEEWRDAIGIETFILVGHGFGGYIATLYAMKYPEKIRHLILVEPWGFTELPFGLAGKAAISSNEHEQSAYKSRIPFLVKVINFCISIFSPLLLLRCVPMKAATWFCSKVLNSISPVFSSKIKYKSPMANYMFYCSSLRASGEYAFLRSSLLYFWSKSPLVERINQLDETVSMSFIYGEKSFVDHKTGFEVFHQRQQSIVEVYMVQNAGHNIFMDCPERFCDIVLHVVEAESQKEVAHNSILLSPCASELDTEDLYWDCAWETINLSQANLSYMENDMKNQWEEEWDDYELDNTFEVVKPDGTESDDDDAIYYPLD